MNLSSLRSWYEQRARREQLILKAGAVAAAVIVLAGVLLPLQRSLVQARERIAAKQEDLAWMQQVAPTIAAAGPAPVAVNGQESLVVLIDRSARESGLGQSLTGSQPSGEGALRVQLEAADFNTLVAWLARLVNQHGLRVESATADGVADPGRVNATVVLRSRT